MKKTRPWITLQGLIAVSIVVCLLAMLVVTAFQGYRGGESRAGGGGDRFG